MKLLLKFLLIGLFMTQLHSAQAQTTAATEKSAIRFNHLALHVYDLKKSSAFYEQVMQFKKIPEPFKDGLHDWFSIGDPYQLHLIQGAPKEIYQDITRHFCFSVPSLDAFMERIRKHNIRYYNSKGEPDKINVRADGVQQIYIQDPDGYWLEINNEY
ncbi:VOC family protein [Rufibacter hautae]|nr:VOC family protein [Rufibacter hautae]